MTKLILTIILTAMARQPLPTALLPTELGHVENRVCSAYFLDLPHRTYDGHAPRVLRVVVDRDAYDGLYRGCVRKRVLEVRMGGKVLLVVNAVRGRP